MSSDKRGFFSAILLPFLALSVVVGLASAAVRFTGDPVEYVRPKSLFFDEVKPVYKPPPPPPPEPPLTEYVAEGLVKEEVSSATIELIDGSLPSPRTVVEDVSTKTDRSEKVTNPRNMAVFFAIDDSGSMRNNDSQNERYQVLKKLLDMLRPGDRVCLTRTETEPVYYSSWLTPSEAKQVVDRILEAGPRSETMFTERVNVNEDDFGGSSGDLLGAIESQLTGISTDDYRPTLLFLGDGDSTNFGYRQSSTVEGLLEAQVPMSGVIFGRDFDARVGPNGDNKYLVEDAEKTGGKVYGAQDVSQVEGIMKAALEKQKRLVEIRRTVTVRFKTPRELSTGDQVRISSGGKTYTLRIK